MVIAPEAIKILRVLLEKSSEKIPETMIAIKMMF
jgi:hypothetical protein